MVQFEHQVRYHEVDQQGYLFNGRFIEIADVAHTEFMRELGWTYAELNQLGVDPSVVHLEADFSRPAKFDDLLSVEGLCTRVGTSSFDIRTRITRDIQEVASIVVTYVNVDARLDQSRPLAASLTAALKQSMSNTK